MATTDIAREIAELETQFIKTLSPEQADIYHDINTLRSAKEVIARKVYARMVANGSSTVTASATVTRQRPASNPDEPTINLRGAVRNEKETFAGKEFSTRQMYDHLLQKHGLVMNDKLSSLSATLANMSASGELQKEVGPQRKVKFSFA